ncbi:MAG TPA: hypothetical protein VMQ62_07115, partial [Dongiaceae bacterium]|nr:hypothetical protein [Dongiaceae bacterium]
MVYRSIARDLGGGVVKRVVMSLHGIRTRGIWQKDLAPTLALNDFIPYALDYGWFSTFEFASPKHRDRKVAWLLSEYERVKGQASSSRPSMIAHSFGTFLVAKLLEKYPEISF